MTTKKRIESEAKAWAHYEFEDGRTLNTSIEFAFNDSGLHSLTTEEMRVFLDSYCLNYRVFLKRYLRKNYDWRG